jgi:hypothetical protein
MQEKHSLGQNIHSYCGKCTLNLEHTIITMDGETMTKVRCKSCGNLHKFKEPLDPHKMQKALEKKCAGDGAKAQIIWESSLAEAKGKEREYSMAAKYRIGDIVNHQTFGKGLVMKLYSNKCDMLFKDGERLMASTNA